MLKTTAKFLLGLAVLVGLAFGSVSAGFAQDLADAGGSEPYHPGMVHYRLGIYFQLKGDHLRAIDEFSQTIDTMPTMGYAYAARGDSYAALGAYESAIVDYSASIGMFPDLVSALYTRGRAYAALGETALAIADYDNAIRQMPAYANPYWGLGDVLFDMGEYPDALDQYQAYVLAETSPAPVVQARLAFLETMVAAGAI